MSLFFAYVDESHDAEKFCLSAIIIRHRLWNESLAECQALRARLRDDFGVKLHSELHAYELVRGKGRSFCTRTLSKWERSRVFVAMLRTVASLPSVKIINVALEKTGRKDAHLDAWDRLFNRLERTARAWEDTERQQRGQLIAQLKGRVSTECESQIDIRLKAYAPRFLVIADEGREREITRALRRMHVHNPVPSKFGAWSSGTYTKNITVSRVVEDPVFRSSSKSLFIQLADAVAYALLKREVQPTPLVKKYGINHMFDDELSSVCFMPASPADPLGIVRK